MSTWSSERAVSSSEQQVTSVCNYTELLLLLNESLHCFHWLAYVDRIGLSFFFFGTEDILTCHRRKGAGVNTNN